MHSLHPSLLAALARERAVGFEARRPREARPVVRRRRLAERDPAPPWAGGRTVNPCVAGGC
jgi:hypothetical protein